MIAHNVDSMPRNHWKYHLHDTKTIACVDFGTSFAFRLAILSLWETLMNRRPSC